ncbi:MAG: hypothetical protein Kow0090_19670 [Myxococcota bacterium]
MQKTALIWGTIALVVIPSFVSSCGDGEEERRCAEYLYYRFGDCNTVYDCPEEVENIECIDGECLSFIGAAGETPATSTDQSAELEADIIILTVCDVSP